MMKDKITYYYNKNNKALMMNEEKLTKKNKDIYLYINANYAQFSSTKFLLFIVLPSNNSQ